MNPSDLEKAAGVGVTVSEAEVREVLGKAVEARKAEILEAGHSYNKGRLLGAGDVKERLMWAEGKLVASVLEGELIKLLGEKSEEEAKEGGGKKKAKKAKKGEEEKIPEEPERDPSTIKLTELMGKRDVRNSA